MYVTIIAITAILVVALMFGDIVKMNEQGSGDGFFMFDSGQHRRRSKCPVVNPVD